MSIIDKNLEFSDNQTMTSISSSVYVTSSNAVDLGASAKDAWGNTLRNLIDGGNMKLNVAVDVVVETADIAAILYTHTAAAAGNTQGTEVCRILLGYSSSAPNYAKAGYKAGIGIPQGQNLQRYLRVFYFGIGGNPDDTAKINCWLSLDTESNYSLAS